MSQVQFTDDIASGKYWQRVTSYGTLFTSPAPPARRIICEGARDLYLIPVGGSAGAGTLFFAGAVAGQAFDAQCDGIGSSTTVTGAVIAQF